MKARALAIISSYMYMKEEKFGFHLASEDLNILWSSKTSGMLLKQKAIC